MIPLTMMLREWKFAHNLNGEKINHLIFVDDVKLFASSDRRLKSLIHTVRVVSTDIGMQFGISKCANAIYCCVYRLVS